MPVLLVPLVERLRVASLEAPHAEPEGRHRRLDDEVEVVRHQAMRQANPSVAFRGSRQLAKEERPVAIVVEDSLPPVAAVGDVVDPTSDLGARRAGHIDMRGRGASIRPRKEGSVPFFRSAATAAGDGRWWRWGSDRVAGWA